MALADQATLARDETFRQRVAVAAVIAATQIAGEARQDGDYDAYYRAREGLAVDVLSNPEGFAIRFAYAVAANPVITADSNDGDLQYTVNSVWDDVAGATMHPNPASA